MAEYMVYQDLLDAMEASGRKYDRDVIDQAYHVAEKAHAGVFRRSGEPYICHPLNVALLLVELGMDTETIAGALLHDVVEDTPITLDDITKLFGPEIALLVDGVTKLTNLQLANTEERQNENLRKMLLAMSKDVRVMIIKLCDRLHNMRTGDAWPEQKRRDKARETMEVYAPIAHRLGINSIKEELEDRSLRYLDDVAYVQIQNLLAEHEGEKFLERTAAEIRKRLDENGLQHAYIKRRVKSIYGIYRKMYPRDPVNVPPREFDEIYDVYALRIIVNSVAECYNALGIVHDMCHPLPNRFKDYISTHKPNGYQSLHTTVIGHEGIPFEVQIRDWEMDRMAEYGVAAHWKYKEGVQGDDRLQERLAWVRQLLESQRESADSTDLLRSVKSDLLPEEVFAFTPGGDVINLPAGSTAIDFAYAIHSEVGNRMIGVKVNNRIAPIEHKVITGEIIEIITGPKGRGPSRNWLKIVKTSQARSKIRSWFKKERREENIREGKDTLYREMRRNNVLIPQEEMDAFLEETARRQHMNSLDDMYAAVGYGGLQVARMMPKIKEEYAKYCAAREVQEEVEREKNPEYYTGVQSSTDGVVVEGIDNCPIKFAKCCKPLPGDPIVGFITRGFGVSIHKRSCPNAISSMQSAENTGRWVRAHWVEDGQKDYNAMLSLDTLNSNGLVGDIIAALQEMHVPIRTISARDQGNGCLSVSVEVSVINASHLQRVVSRLKKVKDVLSVGRA